MKKKKAFVITCIPVVEERANFSLRPVHELKRELFGTRFCPAKWEALFFEILILSRDYKVTIYSNLYNVIFFSFFINI